MVRLASGHFRHFVKSFFWLVHPHLGIHFFVNLMEVKPTALTSSSSRQNTLSSSNPTMPSLGKTVGPQSKLQLV